VDERASGVCDLESLIAEALQERLPIWAPGGALSQVEALVEAYGLTRLDAPNGEMLEADSATYDPDLSQVLADGVDNLRADLATSDPRAEASVTMPWETLAGFRAAVLRGLRVRLVEATQGTNETVSLSACLDTEAETVYVCEEEAAGRPGAGGYAIAAAFGVDARRISHDWVAAWSAALDGFRAEQITTPAHLDAEQKKERDAANEERLRALGERGKPRRRDNAPKDGKRVPKSNQEAPTPETKPKPPRLLVEPGQLDLHTEDGELVGGRKMNGPKPQMPKSTAPTKPKNPDLSKPKNLQRADGEPETTRTTSARRSVCSWSVACWAATKGIIDIRHQHNVSADAVDDLRNYYELKVNCGKIPTTSR
jgi:hypothetical protein